MLDEAHERSLRTDILFGMLKRLLTENKANFKLVIASATLDAEKFSLYFNGARVVYVEGRQHPVRLLCTPRPQEDYLDAATVAIFQIHQDAKQKGDILVFLTGQEEIETLEKLIHEYARYLPPHIGKLVVCPLYAGLPNHKQAKAFERAPHGCRKVILSTNVAETSVTIGGVRFVIDCGFHKVRGFQSKVGIESLVVEPISKASARQRAGRAGREAPGICYRLYPESAFQQLREMDEPEIQRCKLASVVLLMKAVGIDDVLSFDFMDRPPRQACKSFVQEQDFITYFCSCSCTRRTVYFASIGRQATAHKAWPTNGGLSGRTGSC
jgi:HrpA-like RNA helicase